LLYRGVVVCCVIGGTKKNPPGSLSEWTC